MRNTKYVIFSYSFHFHVSSHFNSVTKKKLAKLLHHQKSHQDSYDKYPIEIWFIICIYNITVYLGSLSLMCSFYRIFSSFSTFRALHKTTWTNICINKWSKSGELLFIESQNTNTKQKSANRMNDKFNNSKGKKEWNHYTHTNNHWYKKRWIHV